MSIVMLFLFGLFIGSFLGVLVDRIAKDKPFIKGRSKCDSCQAELKWNDLIPVVSYLFLKGKCRYCKAPLSPFYPIIELTTAVLFALIYLISISNSQFLISNQILNHNSLILNPLSLIINLVYYLFIVSSLIVVFFTDLKYGIIPNKILIPSIVVTIIFLLILNPLSFILNHVLSGLFSFLFLLLISLIFYFLTKKNGLGGGDIKFAFFMGLVLGFPNVITAFYLAFLTGAGYSIILIIWRKKEFLKDSIPFGPFLAISTLISLLFGNFLFQKALSLLGI